MKLAHTPQSFSCFPVSFFSPSVFSASSCFGNMSLKYSLISGEFFLPNQDETDKRNPKDASPFAIAASKLDERLGQHGQPRGDPSADDGRHIVRRRSHCPRRQSSGPGGLGLGAGSRRRVSAKRRSVKAAKTAPVHGDRSPHRLAHRRPHPPLPAVRIGQTPVPPPHVRHKRAHPLSHVGENGPELTLKKTKKCPNPRVSLRFHSKCSNSSQFNHTHPRVQIPHCNIEKTPAKIIIAIQAGPKILAALSALHA